jgi:Zn-dependent peptidase ImmA (M78 family)
VTLDPFSKQSRRIMERHFAGKSREASLRYEVLQRTRRASESAAGEFPPANLELIARNLGVVSIRRVPLAVDGLLVQEDGKYLIKVREHDPDARQRFTIAHELGHLIVREAGNLGRRAAETRTSTPSKPYVWEEELCNYAAAQLLIPDDWAWSFLTGRRPDFSTIAKMADLCKTSLEVAARRLVEVSCWRCRLVWWKWQDGRLRAVRSFPRYDWQTLWEMSIPSGQADIISRVLIDGKPLAGLQSVQIEGEIQNYNVEAWKAGKDTVTSLVVMERLPHIHERERGLFD